MTASLKQSRRHRGALVDSAPPNLNMKHYKRVEILSHFQNVKSPCVNACQTPWAKMAPVENFLATVLV